MNERTIAQHVPILGWLHIAANVVFLLIGIFVFFLLTGIGAVSGDPDALPILTLVGTFVAGVMAVLGLPGILAGYGLLRRRNWGRILGIIVSLLGLLNFPFGTAIGVYSLYVLLQPAAADYFAPKFGSV